MQEYKDRINELKLNLSEFCFFQNRLLSYTKQNLGEVFEKLSGSDAHKQEYEQLMQTKKGLDEQLRQISDKIKDKRHEKVKMKGLSEYQKEIESCIEEQHKVSELLKITQILVKQKEIEAAKKESTDL